MTYSSSLNIFLHSILIGLSAQVALYAQFSEGKGSLEDPFQIATIQDLQQIKNYPDGFFILMNDIKAEETAEWNDQKGFEPIGSKTSPFTGSFDGQNYQIRSLTINRKKQEYVGLFGFVQNGRIRNVHLTQANIQGANLTGGIAGKLVLGFIDSSSISGSISGHTHVGGIVGFNQGTVKWAVSRTEVSGRSYVGGISGINRGIILRSYSSVYVKAVKHNAGGLVGNNYDGSILESESEGTIDANEASSVGGFTGSNGGKILRSFSSAQVHGKSYVGGFVGHNYSGTISGCYSSGEVKGFNLVGGLAGVNRNNGVIRESYTTSPVHGTVDAGGFIGVNRDPVKAGYWDIDRAGQDLAVSKGDRTGITEVNSEQIKGPNSSNEMHELSFNSIWGYLPNQSPQLLWTMPYYMISDVNADKSYISGDLITFKATIKNVGAQADTNAIILQTKDGKILGETVPIPLASGQDTLLIFNWQTSVDDKGIFDLTFQTQYYQFPFQLEVLRLPDMVKLKHPYDLKENVSINPLFTWEKAFLADHYELQISESEDFSTILYDIMDIDTTSYTLKSSLDFLSYYHWRVRGTNEDEKGPWSESSVLISIIERPEVVVLKQPKDKDDEASSTPVFSWAETKRAENYQLQISPDEKFEKVLFDTTVTANDSSLAMEHKLPLKQEYYWRMRASNIGGLSDWSENRSFSTIEAPSKSAVEEDRSGLQYTLDQNFPNPFNPVTNIRYSLPEGTRVELRVLNMLGQTVEILVDGYQSAGYHTVTFDASKLSSGFYIYRIKTPEFTASRKLSLVK